MFFVSLEDVEVKLIWSDGNQWDVWLCVVLLKDSIFEFLCM